MFVYQNSKQYELHNRDPPQNEGNYRLSSWSSMEIKRSIPMIIMNFFPQAKIQIQKHYTFVNNTELGSVNSWSKIQSSKMLAGMLHDMWNNFLTINSVHRFIVLWISWQECLSYRLGWYIYQFRIYRGKLYPWDLNMSWDWNPLCMYTNNWFS